MLRNHFYLALFLLYPMLCATQTDETLRDIPPQAIQLYPTLEQMEGYAVGQYKDYLLIFGGSIRSRVADNNYRNFPNLDILLIDFNENRASAFTNGSFKGSLGEQISATGLSYYQHDGLLFLLGGYGYSETHNQFITFPYITVIDVKQTVMALLNGVDPVASFYQLCDDRMAIFNAEMDYNGDEFFLLNGKSAYKLQPFADNPKYVEEKYNEEIRTFKMSKDGAEWRLDQFETWYDLEAFQEQYGTLIPERIEKQLQQLQQSRTLNQ